MSKHTKGKLQAEILSVLRTAARRDREKHEGLLGIRSTAEIAGSCIISTTKARSELEELFQAGEVKSARDGREIVWWIPRAREEGGRGDG